MKYQTSFARRATLRKYPARPVITTRDSVVQKQWQQTTEEEAPFGPRQFAAGVVHHPHTGLYQVWLSTNGMDVISVSAHRAIIQAEADVRAIKALISSGDLYDDEKTAALFAQLKRESDEEPCQLPDNLVRLITRSILRAVVDRT
jgi:hypothetical protein